MTRDRIDLSSAEVIILPRKIICLSGVKSLGTFEVSRRPETVGPESQDQGLVLSRDVSCPGVTVTVTELGEEG